MAAGALPALPWLAGLEQKASETVSGPSVSAVPARDYRTFREAARAGFGIWGLGSVISRALRGLGSCNAGRAGV
jgi:hypothetical protein